MDEVTRGLEKACEEMKRVLGQRIGNTVIGKPNRLSKVVSYRRL